MICDSKCCRRSGEKIWCKKNLGLKGLKLNAFQSAFKQAVDGVRCFKRREDNYIPAVYIVKRF